MKPNHAETRSTADPTTESPSEAERDANEGIPEGVRQVLEGTLGAPREEPDIAPVAATQAATAPSSAFGNLAIGQIVDVRDDEIDVRIGGRVVSAQPTPTLHAAVLKTASETGEPVLVERGADGSITIIGALRTHPTPGVDRADEVTIEANRIHLRGKREVVLSSGVASLALRAAGEIETYADRIVSRAEELHKLVGRMLRLN